jgi:hypothetical protein
MYEKAWPVPCFLTGIYEGLQRTAQRETERVENAGNVMKEILNVPDNIPQSLSDKTDRVVVFVMKSAVPTPACANQLLETLHAGSAEE